VSLRRPSLALLGLLCAATVVWATWRHIESEEAFGLVRQAATAHLTVSYRGELAWPASSPGRKKTTAVLHDAQSGRTRYTWGRRYSYVTKGPSSRSSDPVAFCLDLEALEENYTAQDLGEIPFLDRIARVLVLRPRHQGRPRVRLVVDRASMLPLKVATYGPDGSLYRVKQFQSIEIGPQESVRPDSRKQGWRSWYGTSVPFARIGEELDFASLDPDYLPKGFRLIDCRISGAGLKRLRLVYSDGLTTFEIEQARVATPAQVEAEYERRYGAKRAKWFMRWYWKRGRGWTTRSESGRSESGGGKTTVQRSRRRKHDTYELKVNDLEVRLTGRRDLESEECLRVLRSLRPR